MKTITCNPVFEDTDRNTGECCYRCSVCGVTSRSPRFMPADKRPNPKNCKGNTMKETTYGNQLINAFSANTNLSSDFMQGYYCTPQSLITDGYDIDPEFLKAYIETDTTKATYAASYGGEGCGDDYYAVIKFTRFSGEEAFIKFYGWYSSYNGAEYEGCYEVEPEEKTITVYNRKDV